MTALAKEHGFLPATTLRHEVMFCQLLALVAMQTNRTNDFIDTHFGSFDSPPASLSQSQQTAHRVCRKFDDFHYEFSNAPRESPVANRAKASQNTIPTPLPEPARGRPRLDFSADSFAHAVCETREGATGIIDAGVDLNQAETARVGPGVVDGFVEFSFG